MDEYADEKYTDPNVERTEALEAEFDVLSQSLPRLTSTNTPPQPASLHELENMLALLLWEQQQEAWQRYVRGQAPHPGTIPVHPVSSWRGNPEQLRAQVAQLQAQRLAQLQAQRLAQLQAQQLRAQRRLAQKQVKPAQQKKKKTKKTKKKATSMQEDLPPPPTDEVFNFGKLSSLNRDELEGMVHQTRDARSPGGTGGPFDFEGGRRKSRKSRKSRKKNRKRRRQTRRRR